MISLLQEFNVSLVNKQDLLLKHSRICVTHAFCVTNENTFSHVLCIHSVNKKVSGSPKWTAAKPHSSPGLASYWDRKTKMKMQSLRLKKYQEDKCLERGNQGEKSHQICMLFCFNIFANSPNIHINETLENTQEARRRLQKQGEKSHSCQIK